MLSLPSTHEENAVVAAKHSTRSASVDSLSAPTITPTLTSQSKGSESEGSPRKAEKKH